MSVVTIALGIVLGAIALFFLGLIGRIVLEVIE